MVHAAYALLIFCIVEVLVIAALFFYSRRLIRERDYARNAVAAQTRREAFFKREYDKISEDYADLKSRIKIIVADPPAKKTVVYSAVKLAAFLKDYITYEDATGKCSLVVVNTKVEK